MKWGYLLLLLVSVIFSRSTLILVLLAWLAYQLGRG